jgi:ribosome-associated toxin RatA of RatAB toxin-antitoxin module
MKVDAKILINRPAFDIFQLLHDYDKRLLWDPFLSEARIVSGSVGVGCRVICTEKKMGLNMETEYVSFRPPRLAAVRMTKGPCFLSEFTGTWLLENLQDDLTKVHFHYNVKARPAILTPVMRALFLHESKLRLEKLKSYLENQ